jgi:hypothetical protein
MKSFAIALTPVIVALSIAVPARADCPDGSRQTSEQEQQAYVSMVQAIKSALPPAPAGWSVKDPTAKFSPAAPTSTCKGLDLVPNWYGSYTWNEQMKRNSERSKEEDAKIRAASAFTPEEQKEIDDWTKRARELERKAVAVIRTNPDEAARLRAEARPFSEKANAVRKAHTQWVAPQLETIRNEYAALYVNPGTDVNIIVSELDMQLSAKEPLQIPGAVSAFINGQKELVMSFGQFPTAKENGGIGTKLRTMWVTMKGDREPAETIAKLLAGSGLSTLAKK